MRTIVLLVTAGLLGLAGCGSDDPAVSAETIEAQLAAMCDERLEGLLREEQINESQFQRACACQRQVLTGDLEQGELGRLVMFERAMREGRASEIPPDERPGDASTAAMRRAAEQCFSRSALGAPL